MPKESPATEAPVVQINAEGACHLSAPRISEALKTLGVDDPDLILIENADNSVCPSVSSSGQSVKIAVLLSGRR